MTLLRFRKAHGAGNDFVLVTDPCVDYDRDWQEEARRLCARRTGIGADGLVVSTRIGCAAFEVNCYNADGSVATMCGNALRCVAFCAARDYSCVAVTLLMAGVEHHAVVNGTDVAVTVEVGEIGTYRVEVDWAGHALTFESAHTGTEHVVAVVEDVDRVDVEGCGRLVRDHPDLAPVGTNVDFVQTLGPQELKIRTYERGVEAETLSCGSGAVAAVAVAAERRLLGQGPVIVHNLAGAPLTVRPHLERREKTFWVSGPVTIVYRGELS